MNDLKADCETKINQIKSDLIQIENRFNARLNENKFYEYNGEQERLLGEILFNNFLIECSKGNHFCIYSKIQFVKMFRVLVVAVNSLYSISRVWDSLFMLMSGMVRLRKTYTQ